MPDALPPQESLAAFRAGLRAQADARPSHLSYEELAAYVDGEMDPVEREIAESHLEECPQCATEMRDLRAFKAEMATYPAREYAPAKSSPFPGRFPGLWPVPAPVGKKRPPASRARSWLYGALALGILAGWLRRRRRQA